MPRSVLSPDDVSLRIKAARMLRGVTQDELAERLREAGLAWRLAGDLERGDAPLLSLHRVALSQALGFPERWFTEPLDDLIPGEAEPDVRELLNRILAAVT